MRGVLWSEPQHLPHLISYCRSFLLPQCRPHRKSLFIYRILISDKTAVGQKVGPNCEESWCHPAICHHGGPTSAGRGLVWFRLVRPWQILPVGHFVLRLTPPPQSGEHSVLQPRHHWSFWSPSLGLTSATAGNEAPDGEGDHHPHTGTHTNTHTHTGPDSDHFYREATASLSICSASCTHLLCPQHVYNYSPHVFTRPQYCWLSTFSFLINLLYLKVVLGWFVICMIAATRPTVYPRVHSHLLTNKPVRNGTPLAAGYLRPAEGRATKCCSKLRDLSPDLTRKSLPGTLEIKLTAMKSKGCSVSSFLHDLPALQS